MNQDEINCFEVETDPDKSGTRRDVNQAFKLWIRLDKTDFGRENSHFLLFGLETVREKKERRESFQVLISSILGVPPVGIRRAKSESSYT